MNPPTFFIPSLAASAASPPPVGDATHASDYLPLSARPPPAPPIGLALYASLLPTARERPTSAALAASADLVALSASRLACHWPRHPAPAPSLPVHLLASDAELRLLLDVVDADGSVRRLGSAALPLFDERGVLRVRKSPTRTTRR